MKERQPIETAPRSGEQILVSTNNGDFAAVQFRRFADGSALWEFSHTKDGAGQYLYPGVAQWWVPLPERAEMTRDEWLGSIQDFLERRIADAPDKVCAQFAIHLRDETAEPLDDKKEEE